MSFSGVTQTLDCQTAIFPDGRVLNVIDTPGLFDYHVESEFIKNEIMKCIELAKDGIHAVILVLSLRSRFTEEEAAAIQTLSKLFGPKITDYMIVLFTGDDCLNKDMSREDFLLKKTPPGIQEILGLCKNRAVFFDNETDDEEKKKLQRTKLLSLLDEVVEDNGGKPYTDSRFKVVEVLQQPKEVTNASTENPKQELIELGEKIQSSYDEQLKRMMEMFESNLKEKNARLEYQVANEREARWRAEKLAEEAKSVAREKVQSLEESKRQDSIEISRLKCHLKHTKRFADRAKANLDRFRSNMRSSRSY